MSINWPHHSDATLPFPQTMVLRYGQFEPDERKQPQMAEDYRRWCLVRLRKLDAHLEKSDDLCDRRFTIADIAVAYALLLAELVTGGYPIVDIQSDGALICCKPEGDARTIHKAGLTLNCCQIPVCGYRAAHGR